MTTSNYSRWLVTGANGFVGNALLERLAIISSGQNTRFNISRPVAASRRPPAIQFSDVQYVTLGDLSTNFLDSSFESCLNNIDVVVHAAARVHVASTSSSASFPSFCRVNVDATLNLARKAAKSGVRRFIFISSIGVHGQSTSPGQFFDAESPFRPYNDYTLSKFHAEQGLRLLSQETGLEVVFIRPPLIYGPNAPGNFRSLVSVIKKGLPLPLGQVDNSRSFIFLGNLIDFIVSCGIHPKAANQAFLISDDSDLSICSFISHLSDAMSRPSPLFGVSPNLLNVFFRLIGRHDLYSKLCCNLQLNIGKSKHLLGWSPPYGVVEGLKLSIPV